MHRDSTVTVYAVLDAPIVDAVTAAFQRAHPSLVARVLRGPPPVPIVFMKELGQGVVFADVLIFNEADLQQVLHEGALARFVPADSDWVAPDLRDADGRWTVALLAILSVAYNTDLMTRAEAPAGFTGLLDPRWRGKIGMADPRSLPEHVDILHALEQEYGSDFVRRLAAQDLRFYPTAGAARDALESGAVPLLISSINGVEARKLMGRPVDWARADDNTYVRTLKWVGIPAGAPHPAAARVFVDWFFSEPGMQAQAGAGAVVLRPGISLANPDQTPSGKRLLHATPLADLERAAFLAAHQDLFSAAPQPQ